MLLSSIRIDNNFLTTFFMVFVEGVLWRLDEYAQSHMKFSSNIRIRAYILLGDFFL